MIFRMPVSPKLALEGEVEEEAVSSKPPYLCGTCLCMPVSMKLALEGEVEEEAVSAKPPYQ